MPFKSANPEFTSVRGDKCDERNEVNRITFGERYISDSIAKMRYTTRLEEEEEVTPGLVPS